LPVLYVQEENKMSDTQTKLMGKKQIIILSCAASVGIGFSLYRQHYENGTLTSTDFFASGAAVVMIALIFIFMARKGNKE